MWEDLLRKLAATPACHPIWSKILCRRDLKNVHPIIAKVRKANDRRWSRVAATRDANGKSKGVGAGSPSNSP